MQSCTTQPGGAQCRILARVIVAGGIAIWSAAAAANQQGADGLCQKYPKAAGCESAATRCAVCHAGGPPALNPYGDDIKKALAGASLAEGIAAALGKVEQFDSDGDGVKNVVELSSATQPGDPASKPAGDTKLVYDPIMAMKRIKAIYCGQSASFDELQKVKAAGEDAKPLLHAALTTCLQSPFWTGEALQRLADKKIQPLNAVGFGGNVVIADFRFDYRLFAYIMSGDRDVRELLSATYHIDEKGQKIEGTIAREERPQVGQRIVIAGGQPLAPSRRAGMMTTQWFLSFYTMFSPLPRNTASQVYREYLGMDIAKGEGLMAIANEPRDVDNRNVKQTECAACHSTLDPLAYSFSTYVGIDPIRALLFNANGTYSANRAPWEAEGALFGQPVTDLLDWADKARNSEAFKKNIGKMMFTQALSREPMAHEQKEFEALWQGLATDNYSVNKLVHRFVDTLAFGGRLP